jgi:hypothetical protein
MQPWTAPEHEKRQVVEYMEAEAPDETVQHAEKIATERVFRNEYFVCDVHSDQERWWIAAVRDRLGISALGAARASR